jgi:hypothetical protein
MSEICQHGTDMKTLAEKLKKRSLYSWIDRYVPEVTPTPRYGRGDVIDGFTPICLRTDLGETEVAYRCNARQIDLDRRIRRCCCQQLAGSAERVVAPTTDLIAMHWLRTKILCFMTLNRLQ